MQKTKKNRSKSEDKKSKEIGKKIFDSWAEDFSRRNFMLGVIKIDCWIEEDKIKALKNHLKFHDSLIELCKKFDFDPVNIEWEYGEIEKVSIPQLKSGKVDFVVAEELLKVLRASSYRYRQMASFGSKKASEKIGKPRRISPQIAEDLLVGIAALRGSNEGLGLIRKYVSLGGGLSSWAADGNFQGFGSRGEAEDLRDWADKIRLDLLRIMLSEGKKKIVRSFMETKTQKELVLDKIKVRADALVASATNKNK